MKKRMMTAAAVVFAALVSVPATAHAETFSGGDDWRVVFDGENLDSTFTNAQIDDTIYQMQPGDTADIHLELRNDYPGDTWWYMTNEVLRTLDFVDPPGFVVADAKLARKIIEEYQDI